MSEQYRENEYYEEEFVEEEDKNKRRVRILLILLAVLLIIGGAAYTGVYLYNQYLAGIQETTAVSLVTEAPETTAKEKPKNPVDFKELKGKNDEIYAWLKVPGTKVDYPIVQSKKADDFYLNHSAYTKKYLASGAVYTESVNSTKFDDRVTVVYGHNGYSDKMFTTLHKFESKEFFDKHSKFYIYQPHRRLTYRIVSAFKYDDRHIMNSFFFDQDPSYQEFLTMIQNPETGVKNVRKKLDKELTINDNICVLSTCIKNQRSKRYLVCGVLIKDEETN